jgi:prevent-host-death family protein
MKGSWHWSSTIGAKTDGGTELLALWGPATIGEGDHGDDRMAKSWSVRHAKNLFSKVVDAARRRPQTVTKHGRPVVVVVDVLVYERLRLLTIGE